MNDIDYIDGNRRTWNEKADEYAEYGRRAWAAEPTWGVWGVAESEVGLLEGLHGDAIELGCGTGYVSAWLARRGLRPIGLDNSPRQLATARALQEEYNLRFPLIHGIAEMLPFADASFDVAISEYGAAIWSDPYIWIPEAARVLRPGGRLVFLGNAALIMLCANDDENIPATPELLRPYFGMHRFEWPDQLDGVEFHIPHGDMIRLLRSSGFDVLDLVEIQVPTDATAHVPFVTAEWGHQWPTEEIWVAELRA